MTSMIIPARQAERAKRIGSGDIAAVLGLDPYKTGFDLWLQKRGHVAEQAQSEASLMGELLEPIVAQRYQLAHPDLFVEPCETLVGSEPFFTATPDRRVYEMVHGPEVAEVGREWLLEIKTKSSWSVREFGEPGTDQVPPAILAQVMWQLGIAGFDYADIAVLVDGRQYREYGVHYDARIFSTMEEQARLWWQRHMVDGREPELKGASVVPYLRDKFREVTGDVKQAEEADEQLLAAYGVVVANIKEQEARKEQLQTELMIRIAEAPGLKGALGSVSWRHQKGRTTTDYKALVAALNVPEDVLQQYTRVSDPIRVFRFTPAKVQGDE